MPRRRFELSPVESRLSKEVRVLLTREDYRRIKALSDERGEKGPAAFIRRLALAALEELER